MTVQCTCLSPPNRALRKTLFTVPAVRGKEKVVYSESGCITTNTNVKMDCPVVKRLACGGEK